jgi:Cu-processing system permease protein
MRARETSLVAARELREALRSRWFVAAAVSFLGLSLGLALLGMAGAQRSGLAGFDRTTASLLNLALLFIPLLTLSIGGLSFAGELEDGSLAMLLSQPITRAETFLGKYLGLCAAVFAAILGGFGATGVIVGIASGGGNVGAFLGVVGLMLLEAAVTLGIGTLLSVTLRSRVRVVGAAFALWLAMIYLSDLGTIGLAVARNLGPAQVFGLALVNPVELSRILGTIALTDRIEVLGPVGIYGLDHFGLLGVVGLCISLLLIGAVALVLGGYWIFRKAVVT